MTNIPIDYLLEKKCKEKGCYNYSEQRYIYCIHHLHGFPQRMDDEDVERVKATECEE